MKLLEKRIVKDGLALGTEIVKVDSFLNHQIDIEFILHLGREFQMLFGASGVNKILTMESSGISIAMATAMAYGNIPVLFAKKAKPNTMVEDVYQARVKSFTKGVESIAFVSRKFLSAADRVLIIDDFLAHGEAACGMVDIVRQAGAELIGVGAVIEKEFQGGGTRLRAMGVELHSLACISKIENGWIHFKYED
ncbi:MAG: xanthine phosphoribosyltransferase [Bacillota bacterium]|nr:xanthine phosphoribosyltransferase [Bacillota bacterium]